MATDAATITPGCTLAPISAPWVKGTCVWCAGPLGKGLRRWCSGEHATLFTDNHVWNMARGEAIARASLEVERRKASPYGDYDYVTRLGPWCDQCGVKLNQVRPNRWGGADIILATQAEVNHVEPRVGQGYDVGCWNHQTNLQVLCHSCHVVETTQQLWDRKGGRPSPVVKGTPTVDMPSLWDSITG